MRLTIILLALLSCAAAVAETLTLYTWEDYLDADVVSQFENETGHKVVQVFYGDESIREEVITSGRAAAYDLLILDHVSLTVLESRLFFTDLSTQQQQLASMLDPRWSKSCGNFGIPYAWGTMGIAYRSSAAEQPISSWQQLFSLSAEHRDHTVMYLDQIDGIAAALLAAGHSPYSNDTEQLKQAYQLLKQQQPHVLSYGYGLVYAQENPVDNQMTLTLAYSGEAEAIGEALGQDDWQYVVPNEGTTLWVDCLVAPKQRPLTDAAKAFIAFLNQPEIAAQNAEAIWFASPNTAALPLTSSEYRNDEVLFPAPEVIEKSHDYQPLSADSLRLRSRMLTKFQ